MRDLVAIVILVAVLAGVAVAAARQGYLHGREVGYRQCLGERDD